jgi:hypothetical protein
LGRRELSDSDKKGFYVKLISTRGLRKSLVNLFLYTRDYH